MRTLLKTICLLLCLGFATESKGQTVEQTIEWLNSKIPSLCISEDFGKTIKFNNELCMKASQLVVGDKRIIQSHSFNYIDIKSVSYIQEEIKGQPHYVIKLTGNFNENEIGYNGEIINSKKIRVTDFTFNPSVQKEEIIKIVKALKHIASLKGAKLVNDDLF